MSLSEAREALKARQGLGARYDAPEAPAEALALARSGTAYFARKLNELGDAALYQQGRAAIVARVAFQARAIARQAEAVTAGAPVPGYETDDVALAETLPPRALRHLFDHAAIHLDVCWRDLPGPGWDAVCDGPDGLRPLCETPMQRARLIWQAALDLNNGARARDLPPVLRDNQGKTQ